MRVSLSQLCICVVPCLSASSCSRLLEICAACFLVCVCVCHCSQCPESLLLAQAEASAPPPLIHLPFCSGKSCRHAVDTTGVPPVSVPATLPDGRTFYQLGLGEARDAVEARCADVIAQYAPHGWSLAGLDPHTRQTFRLVEPGVVSAKPLTQLLGSLTLVLHPHPVPPKAVVPVKTSPTHEPTTAVVPAV